MKKILVLGLIIIGILVGCGKEEVKEDKNEVKQETQQKDDFDPAEFVKEAEKHDAEWYIASVSKLTPEQAEELEKYQKEIELKHAKTLQSILANAKTKELVNQEGQKVIEYTMLNTLGYDVEWFQLEWKEADGDNVSQTANNIKNGQEFKLIVDPAFDKTLNDIDLNTLKLNSSN